MQDTMSLKPDIEAKEDDVVRMRQRLEKMGNSKKPKKRLSRKASDKNIATKNHRFIGDGQVQVEKHALSRPKSSNENRKVRFDGQSEREKGQLQQFIVKLKKRVALVQKQLELVSEEHRRLKLHYNDLESLCERQKKNLDKKNSEIQAEHARILTLEERLRDQENTIISLRSQLASRTKQSSKATIDFDDDLVDEHEEEDDAQPIKWWKD